MATYKGRHCIAGTGATGAQGIQGNKGDKGDAATVAVSSTVTLAPGSQAKVENEGDSHNAKFKFLFHEEIKVKKAIMQLLQ